MELHYTILLFAGFLLAAIAFEPLAEKIRLPFTAALILIGYAGSELVISFGFDTGVRWDSFYNLIFFVFIPVLIFEASFTLDARLLLKNIFPILFLAVPLMLLSAGLIAVFVYYAIDRPIGFPWIAALLTGALLSATDPVAVLALFKKSGAPERLILLMDGESLFNDAAAVVLFSALISLALMGHTHVGFSQVSFSFLSIFAGGALTGLVLGAVGWLLLPMISHQVAAGVFSLILAYSGFVIAESLLHVSGVMAVLLTGLIMGQASRKKTAAKQHGFLLALWEYKAWLANALLFLMAGITVQLAMFRDQWLAIIIGILAALFSRAIGIYGLIPLLNRMPGVEPINMQYRSVMYWGGIRGAITLALALSLPVELPYWWTIQSIAYGVVLFTLFVQAPTMAPLLKRLGI